MDVNDILLFISKTVLKNNSLYGPKIKPIISRNEIEIDIDSAFDMFIAEMTKLHWKKYSQKFNKK